MAKCWGLAVLAVGLIACGYPAEFRVRDGGTDAGGGGDGPVSGGCEVFSACVQCTGNTGCGWCVSTGRCLAINASGTASADGTCTGMNWDPDGESCTGPGSLMAECMGGNASCDACTNLGDCGWCAQSNRCLVSNADGTGSYDGTCSGASWKYTPDECTVGDGGM